MLKPLVKVVWLLAGVLLLIAPVIAQDTLTPQKFLLTFIPNIQFAPVYVAQEMGYFAEAGMEVTLEYLNEPDVLDLVAAGQEQFGMVSGEQVILAAAQQRPILYVYGWYQKYPVGIVYNPANGIASVNDLAGRKVGIPGRFGASYSGLTSLLMAAGMTENDIQLEEIGFNAPEVFCLGGVEAAVVYISNEPLQIRNRIAAGECGDIPEVAVFPVAASANLVSNGIVTSTDYATTNPEQVAAFVGAFDAGLQATINNPARAYLLSAAHVEDLPLSEAFAARLTELADAQDEFLATEPDHAALQASWEELLTTIEAEFTPEDRTQFEVLLASVLLWDAEQLGVTTPEAWQAMADTLAAMGMLTDEVNLSSVYTNDFIPVIEQ